MAKVMRPILRTPAVPIEANVEMVFLMKYTILTMRDMQRLCWQ